MKKRTRRPTRQVVQLNPTIIPRFPTTSEVYATCEAEMSASRNEAEVDATDGKGERSGGDVRRSREQERHLCTARNSVSEFEIDEE